MHVPPSITGPRQQVPLRLLLALLLFVSPLLSVAQAPAATDNTAGATALTDQMPCHSDTGGLDSATIQADCPHCTGDAPASHCQCCDQAAPAGLVGLNGGARGAPVGDDNYLRLPSDDVPRSPDERHYRPPIQSS